MNIDGQLVSGTLLVATIVPSNTVCSPGGYGYLNFFDYETGGAPSNTNGIVSAAFTNTIVGINVMYINGNPVLNIVDSGGGIIQPPVNPPGQTPPGFNAKRVLWRELNPQ